MPRYETVAMFATDRHTGSQVSVVPDAESLHTADMQAIATLLGTTETAFVLPPDAGAGYRVRIFTSEGESPFGGHAALGVAATLVRLGNIPAGHVVQQVGDRRLALTVEQDIGTIAAYDPLAPTPAVATETLIAATGLDPGDVVDSVPVTAGFGPSFHYLRVRPGAEQRAVPDFAVMAANQLADVTVFSWDEARRTAHARLFAPGYGMPEDPACASTALGLGVWLVRNGLLPDSGMQAFTLRQGDRAHSSTLDCAVTVLAGTPVAASVTGQVVPVTAGHIDIPACHEVRTS